MPVIWLTMRGIFRHYASVALELTPPQDAPVTLPSSNRAIVLVSKLHLPTLRALAYARATGAQPPGGHHGRGGRGRDGPAQGGMGPQRAGRAADRDRLAVPGDHPAGGRLRQAAAPGKPARHRDGFHPRVRARPLVGADPAQPDGPAAQGQAAPAARSGRRQRAVSAEIGDPPPGRAATRSDAGGRHPDGGPPGRRPGRRGPGREPGCRHPAAGRAGRRPARRRGGCRGRAGRRRARDRG